MQEIDRITLRRLSRRSDGRGSPQLALHGTLLWMTGVLVYSARGTGWLLPVMIRRFMTRTIAHSGNSIRDMPLD